MTPIVVFGLSDFAEVVQWYLTNDSEYNILAFTVNAAYIDRDEFCGKPVVPFEEIEQLFPPTQYKMFIAVGYSRVNSIRAQLFKEAKSKGYELISYINSTAVNQSNVKVGENCFIFEKVVIQPFSSIGNNVIIWSSSLLAHHSIIKDHCFIAHNVAISGHVTIESYCFIGGNSTIRDRVIVAERTVIGAGAVILEDTQAGGVYKGLQSESLPFDSSKLKAI